MSECPMFVWATVDAERELALLTGRGVKMMLVDAGLRRRWSESGHGYVVNLVELSDLSCWCCEQHVPYRERPM